MVFAADEYYLMAERPFPPAATYEGFPQHENGLGMARAFEAAFGGDEHAALGVRPGFFAAVDGAPAAGYRAPRAGPAAAAGRTRRPTDRARRHPHRRVRCPGARPAGRLASGGTTSAWCRCANHFFGGNIGVSGPADRHRPDRRPGRRSPRATATCCPTPASPRAASSTT